MFCLFPQECLSAAVSVHDWQYQTKALVNIASLYLEANNTHQAVIYYEKLLDLQREMRGDSDEGPLPDYWSPELECSLYLNASIAYKAIGAIDRAVWHAEKYATLMKDKENRKHALAQSHQNVGMLQEILGKPLEALESYKLFLKASKEKGDDANIARAYGCLGSVYATLKNRQLSLTYHDQHVSLVRALGDSKMLASALEQMGDTYMKMELPLEAVNSYMEMFQNIPRNDVHRQTTALCKLGSANKELGRFQYSLYYYEQAKMIADDFDFNDIKVFCEFNQACILQYSTQHYEMQQARTYFEKLIPLLEAKIHQHQEEATFCSQELHDQLTKCYDGMQLILKKLEQKEVHAFHYDVIKWKHFPRHCPLCGEFTGHRWIPLTKGSDAELSCFLWSVPWINGWVNNGEAGDLRRYRAHYDITVIDITFLGTTPVNNRINHYNYKTVAWLSYHYWESIYW